MGYTQRVDSSRDAQLAVCSCGWRELRSSRTAARAAITEHVGNCHPETLHHAQRLERLTRQRHG